MAATCLPSPPTVANRHVPARCTARHREPRSSPKMSATSIRTGMHCANDVEHGSYFSWSDPE